MIRVTRLLILISALPLLLLAWGCVDDFPSDPSLITAVAERLDGPATLAVTDEATFELIVVDGNGVPYEGLEIDWQVTDSTVLVVAEETPIQDGTRADSLIAQLKARVAGLRSSSAELIATVVHRGIEGAEARIAITVVPLTIEPVVAWPDTLMVRDEAILELSIRNAEDAPVNARQVTWQSSGNVTVMKLDTLRAQVVANARGPSEVVAILSEQGFEPDTVRHSITVMERWISVTAGAAHTCGLTVDSVAYCWGSGFIGNGSAAGSALPTRVAGNLKFAELSAGDSLTCGRIRDGTAYCWGRNLAGGLGNGTTIDQLSPVPVALGATFSKLVGGEAYVCGLSETAGYCWGLASVGQLGDAALNFNFVPPTPDPPYDNCARITGFLRCSVTPRRVRDPLSDPLVLQSVAPGGEHTCGVLADGGAVCWGNHARWGNLTLAPSDSSIPVPGSLVFESVTTALWHSCAIENVASTAHCWGFDTFGQLGDETAGSITTCDTAPCSVLPVAVRGMREFEKLSAGGHSTCAVTIDGEGFCWGSDEYGQLGNDSSPLITTCRGVSCSREPIIVELPTGSSLVTIAVGQRHACGVTPRGVAYCWGDGEGGKLGSNSLGSTLPLRVHEPLN